jgi:Glycosyl hydrolases family 39/Bacterial Ig-like domain (group 2)
VRLSTTVIVFLLATQVSAQISVSIAPAAACMVTSQQQQFQATVTGASDTSVSWYVDNVKGGYSSGGFINASGLYTAPKTANTHYVQAISNADNTTTAVVQVLVRGSAGVTMLPVSVNVMVLSSQSFGASACGLSNSGVTWSVDGVVGGNASGGTIDASGTYTAPGSPGNHSVKATSTADSSKSATASVTVYSQVTADFTSRTSTANSVPAGTFGTQLGFLFNGFYSNKQGMSYLTTAGLTSMRVDALLQSVYAGTTADWSQVDAVLSSLQAAGVRPLVVMGYTPPSLQPSPNSCANYNAQPYHAVPTDIQQWATLAQAWVAHVDQKFPGYVTDYEIWNEPDNSPGLCVPDNSDASRLSAYLQMYAAAAPLMKQQAAADSVSIRTGGPALTSSGTANEWIPALTTNAGTAPYVDFVSYHNYATSPLVEQSGSTWDNVGAPESLSFRTLDPGSGFAAIYRNIVNLVKKGSQPNPSTTPVILGEYNTTASFTPDCCRNDRVYAPLFNTLVMQGLLNAFKLGLPVPEHALYFAAQNWYPDKQGTVWFCLIGTIDPLMDCAYSASTAQPYPQYYAYNLLLGANYLGLGGGGFMVQTTPAISGAGLAVSGFYTAGNDALVLTNPTTTDYNNVAISLQNTGNLPVGNGYTGTISVPHYSVVAISLSASGPQGVLVGVSPASATVAVNQKQQFTATVSGATNPSVTWSVDNVLGGSSTMGTVSSSGLYTAPAAAGQHTVTATSVQDPTRSASAQVTVKANPVAVSVAPSAATLAPGQTQQFQATVTNTSNTNVTWSVDGTAGGSAQIGTIAANGLYTAPATAGTHTVTAISQADASASGSAQVTVTNGLTIDPSTASVTVGKTQAFRAAINGTTESATWSVDNVIGGNANTGTISSTGTYTAPASPGQHTITATLQSSNQSATAQVTVTPDPAFSLALSTSTVTLNAGASAQLSLMLAPSGFAGSVSMACTGAPLGAVCSVAPHSLVLDGTNPASSTILITTTARSLAVATPSGAELTALLATLALPLLVVTPAGRRRSRTTLLTAGTLLLIVIMTGCGGGGGSNSPPPPPTGTPAGTYSLTITATAGQTTRTAEITLKVN